LSVKYVSLGVFRCQVVEAPQSAAPHLQKPERPRPVITDGSDRGS
jgi:hypothetical protein